MVTPWATASNCAAFIDAVERRAAPALQIIGPRGVVTIADVMLTILPHPRSIMPGSTACRSAIGAR